jgi:hypothetical protein
VNQLKNKILYIIAIVLLHVNVLQAQELKCNVIVNKDQLSASSTGGIINTALIDDMKLQITDFMNTRKWTTHTYSPQERINCNILINLKEVTPNSVTAIAQIQASRPVYGATYESVTLNYIDANFDFDYVQSQPIDYSDNNYTNNLSSLLAFYAYLVLTYDYDTFSKLGGTPFLDKAQQIVNNASSSSFKGWRTTDGINSRSALIDNLISPQMMPIRESLYTYYRLDLDDMQKDAEKARKDIMTNILPTWKKVHQLKPGTILVRSLLQAKDNELIGIFSEASPEDKQKVFDILKELDPTSTEKFQKGLKL